MKGRVPQGEEEGVAKIIIISILAVTATQV
jgi:hypothetical protein